MTEQEYKELLAIRDGAPKGATHFDECEGIITYITSDGRGWHEDGDYYIKIQEYADIHSLSDIENQIEMYGQLQALKNTDEVKALSAAYNRIAPQEKDND